MPDFIFHDEKGYSIGVEVVECHPSVNINKKRNAVERNTFKNKVCNIVQKNIFLESMTKEKKLNIFIDRYIFTKNPYACRCKNKRRSTVLQKKTK